MKTSRWTTVTGFHQDDTHVYWGTTGSLRQHWLIPAAVKGKTKRFLPAQMSDYHPQTVRSRKRCFPGLFVSPRRFFLRNTPACCCSTLCRIRLCGRGHRGRGIGCVKSPPCGPVWLWQDRGLKCGRNKYANHAAAKAKVSVATFVF